MLKTRFGVCKRNGLGLECVPGRKSVEFYICDDLKWSLEALYPAVRNVGMCPDDWRSDARV